MRAFLSHSSKDKPYVEAVAKELGRQFCVYDVFSFSTGEDFRKAIREGLDRSTIFVLFASKNALAAPWVRFEQDEAELRVIQGNISRVVVIILPDGTTHRDLPAWLQRAKVYEARSVKAAVREIQYQIQALFLDRQQPIYVGRQKERAEAEDRILTLGGPSAPPRIFFAWGLAGIGRRTFCVRVAQDLFNLRKHIVFRVQEGDELPDVAIQLAEHAESFGTVAELRSLAEQIRKEGEEGALLRIGRYVDTFSSNSEFAIFSDDGGLIDANGDFSVTATQLVQQVAASLDGYSAFVSTRKPRIDSLASPLNSTPEIRIDPLSEQDIGRLVARLADAHSVAIGKTEVAELAGYLRGYPPAAHYAVDLIRNYGVSAILANKAAISSFQSRRFVAYLSRYSALVGLKASILSVLSYYSPLPLAVIGESLDADRRHLTEALTNLIDISLVIPEGTLYRIADPVIDSVLSIIDRTKVPHRAIAESLHEYLAGISSEDDGVLHMARALRRARLYAGLAPSTNEIAFVSDLMDLQKRAYHERDYEASIKFGAEALAARSASVESRTYLVRALAQVARFQDAITEIEPLRKAGLLREVYFLTGFVERLRGNTSDAVNAYLEALRRGRRGLAVHRELALCFALLGDDDNAAKHLDEAAAIQADNRYVIDLQIQIAIRRHDEKTARRTLAVLQDVDREEFFLHRKSTVEFVFGNIPAALEASKAALGLTKHPTVAMVAQAAKCAIDVGDVRAASDYLQTLRDKFPSRAAELLPRLECRLDIARGRYEDALALLEAKVGKGSPVYVLLKIRILEGLLKRTDIPAKVRTAYREELDALTAKIQMERIVDVEAEFA